MADSKGRIAPYWLPLMVTILSAARHAKEDSNALNAVIEEMQRVFAFLDEYNAREDVSEDDALFPIAKQALIMMGHDQ